MVRKGNLQKLRERGFDQSSYNPGSGSWRVKCSQCEALVINGVAAHETGCPNTPREATVRHYEDY